MKNLVRRVEEASMNAWPATHQLLLDGWLVRLSNGFTKRANCVVPVYDSTEPGPQALLDKVRYCENLYAREQLQTIFRLTSEGQCDSLDALLADRGYSVVDETEVQVLDLIERSKANDSASEQSLQPSELHLLGLPEWLQVYAELAEMPRPASELHQQLIRSIRPDCAFAVLLRNNEPVACALGVQEHGLLGLFDVITARHHRGQGLGGALLQQILDWATDQGVAHAYLQVIANNEPARSLYQGIGFRTLYRYWYRLTN